MRVAIIGGGPSGLVQLKVLLEAHQRFPVAPFEVKLFESHSKIGGIFFHHSYEDGELVSSKYLTTFSDFRPRPGEPDFFSSERYLEYLDDYASHFRLWPHIHLNTFVKSVRRGDTSEHVVTYKTPDGETIEWECDAIAVCSGVHAIPNVPNLPGAEYVPSVMHSSEFKTREQFGDNKTIMIMGSGETSCDLAYLAITGNTKQVVFCHRDGFLAAPKRLPSQVFLPSIFGTQEPEEPDLPVDVSQVTLFDTMYVHPIVRDSMIIWNYYHYLALPIGSWLCSGSASGTDQWVAEVPAERFHISRLFFNKAWQRVQQHISYPYRPTTWSLAHRIRRFIYHKELPPPARTIDMAPLPTHISEDGVAHFPLTGRPEAERIQKMTIKPDVLIYATGYLPSFPFLNGPDNKGRKPYPEAFDANVRQMWKSDDPTVAFIGFIRPGFGAIPPLAELQAMLFTMSLMGRIPKPLDPDDEWHYRMLLPPDSRVCYGVEHDSYAYQLAKDIDCAPSFADVLRSSIGTRNGWRLPYVWAACGPANPKFRLRGPWKWEGAPETIANELWETVSRREGAFGNVPFSIIPMFYLGIVNLVVWIYATLWGFLVELGLAKPIKRTIVPKMIMEEMIRKKEKEGKSKELLHRANGKMGLE